MSYHIGDSPLMVGVTPETKLSTRQLELLRDTVLRSINRTIAYKITNYIDWLCYYCIRYIEAGGIDDLSHIEQGICFQAEVPYQIIQKVTNDIYDIIRPILINAELYRNANINPKFNIQDAVDLMVKHCKDVNWDAIKRSIEILEGK